MLVDAVNSSVQSDVVLGGLEVAIGAHFPGDFFKGEIGAASMVGELGVLKSEDCFGCPAALSVGELGAAIDDVFTAGCK